MTQDKIIETVKDDYAYIGKPLEWKRGFDAAWKEATSTKPQPASQEVLDAERYRCLCSMATKDYERSVSYQFVGKLNDFVDDIKPYVDAALAAMKEGK